MYIYIIHGISHNKRYKCPSLLYGPGGARLESYKGPSLRGPL